METAVLLSLAGYIPCLALAESKVTTYFLALASVVKISRDVIVLL